MARRRLEAAIQAGKAIQQGLLSCCKVTENWKVKVQVTWICIAPRREHTS